jgi:hypothetical protein
MIIVMRPNVADSELAGVTALIDALSLTAHVSKGAERTSAGRQGDLARAIRGPRRRRIRRADLAQLQARQP